MGQRVSKTHAEVAAEFGVTEDQCRRFAWAMRRCWNNIACDIEEADDMPVDEIVEVCVDADRLDMFAQDAGSNKCAVWGELRGHARVMDLAEACWRAR